LQSRSQKRRNNVNPELVEVGAILHDLGRCRTHGIAHAVEGFKLAKNKGVEPEVAEIKMIISPGVWRKKSLHMPTTL